MQLRLSPSREYPSWLAPVAIAVTILVFQLCTINLYGVTWDEPLHRNWAELFLRYWESGDSTYLQAMPGNGMYYGPAYFLLNYAVSLIGIHTFGMSLVASSHLLGILVTSACCAFLFCYVRSAFGNRTAWLSTAFLVTYPQLVAHAQYNPKDIPVLAAAVCVFAALSMLIKRRTFRWAVVSGAALGLGIAAKLSAISLIPSLAIVAVVSAWQEYRAGDASALRRYATWSAIIAGTAASAMIAAWPTLWHQPSLLLGALQFFLAEPFWPGKVLYFGVEYSGGSLPWHYMPVQFFLATPILTFVCLLAGTFFVIRFSHRRDALILLCWFWVPLMLTLKPGMPRYDGIRQLLFCVPALCILAAIGLEALARHASSRFSIRVVSCVVCALFAWNTLEVVRIFPFGGSYVNESVRIALPRSIHDTFELEFWGATYLQAYEWLLPRLKPGDRICVPIAEYLMTWYDWPSEVDFECSAASTYIVYFTRYSKAYRQKFSTRTPVFEIVRFHTPLLQIYAL
jgi:4-amino-4-deoxy-L-arabinose transferase-like glycosyltransferase